MRHLLFLTLALFAVTASAQEYSYTITPEQGGTFTLDIVTELSDSRQSIDRTSGLDTFALQRTQYTRIQALRERQARLEVEIQQAQRQITALFSSLNGVGLNQYAAYQRTNLDSFYVADWWRYSDSEGAIYDVIGQYRENNTTVLRLQSDNTAVAVIVPKSPNWIRLNFQAGYDISGETYVEMFSTNGRDFRGQTCGGVNVRLRKVQ